MGTVFQETQGRVLDGGPLQQIFGETEEGYHVMLSDPGFSYRCGSLALTKVAMLLHSDNTNAPAIMFNPSPASGFSMSALKDLADRYQLNLVPVQRVNSQQIVVPCVIHWNLNHYAAITAQKGNQYLVEDPTFEHALWMDADAINAEASGYFLIPFNQIPFGWQVLTKTQTDQIVGRGNPTSMDDTANESCPTDEAGDDDEDPNNVATTAYPPDPEDEPSPCNRSGWLDTGCTNCCPNGMPTWRVMEPYINLWVSDAPTFYTKTYGKRQRFKLMYKQRNTRISNFSFGFGTSWECNRLAYFHQSSANNFTHWVAGGGSRTYTDGVPEYQTRAMSVTSKDGSGNLVSVSLTFPNSAALTFGYVYSYYSGMEDVYMTKQTDRFGRSTTYNYSVVNGYVHMTSLSDNDGRSTSFTYGAYYRTNAITKATDPWGHTTQLGSDNSAGTLNYITDAAGLTSYFYYDGTTGWLTNLTTPYGTTSFQFTDLGNPFPTSTQAYSVDRSCIVTHPTGAKEMYIYRRDCFQLNDGNTTSLLPSTWSTSDFPTLPYSTSLANSQMNYNNSFRWDRKQYDALNGTFAASNPPDFTKLTTNDYFYARLRHWLYASDLSLLTGTLCMQREGSPDGTAEGQTRWYDYPGKVYSVGEGTNSFPQTAAWVLPNGQTYFRYVERNSQSRPTLVMTSYGDGSTYRTNILGYYSNNQDLQYEQGPNGEVLRGYSFNGSHQVTSFTNAVQDVTSYVYDAQGRIYQRALPSQLTTTYSYGSDGLISQASDNLGRSQSWTYQNSFPRTYTDFRGMTVTNTWDNIERFTESDYPDGTSETAGYTYLDLTSQKDRLGNYTYFGYDALREKIAETNANNVVTRYGYCDCGALMYITNAFGSSIQAVTSFVSV